MERLHERLAVAGKAIARFDEALAIQRPRSLERDAAIQRFEFTFEALWKAARSFLLVREGLDLASPKGVIRACREIGLLTDGEAVMALTMADDRNLTVHTYNEPLAIEIYERLGSYGPLLRHWLSAMIAVSDLKE